MAEGVNRRESNIYCEWLLEEFECPVCGECMHPPIFQCQRAHCLCIRCFTRVQNCPLCRAPKSTTRNIALEILESKTMFPCKNKSEGCLFIDLGSYILEHESDCLYGPIPCLLNAATGCSWAGQLSTFLSHIQSRHPNYLHLNGSSAVYHDFVKEEGASVDGWFHGVFTSEEEIFKCLLNVDYSSGQMRWDVFYYGLQQSPRDYTYQIRIENYNKSSERVSLSSFCKHFQTESTFRKNQCLFTNYHVLKKMCKAKDLIFTLRVYKNNYIRSIKPKH